MTTHKTQFLDDLFEEEIARLTTPDALAQAEADVRRSLDKGRAETQRLIASGALQPDGEPWDAPEADEEDEEDQF